MALIARIQHPYIVEFKEAWVEKVRDPFKFFYGLIVFLFFFQQIVNSYNFALSVF